MNGRRAFSVLLLVLISLSLGTNLVLAQDQQPNIPSDDAVNAIAKELYCPVCENTPLDVCGTQACAQWRELIREKISEGWSKEQIKQYFVDQYGDRVLAEPPRRGINWLVYIFPPLMFIGGVYLLYKGFRTWTQKSLEKKQEILSKTSNMAIDDEYIKRMEETLLEDENS
ncbi:MAG: cytochrome c-type biogenesis protein CcmH [Anaerolineales bacterium]|nr:cytochrome c-type biogenesis protein CcmH [Anaerolineales bacterium]